LRANGVLSGVVVPQGASRVELRVVPDAYRWIALGQVASILAIFALLAVILSRRRGDGGRDSAPTGANG
jgi:uncharacterized membrane protein YfhO